MRVTDHEMQVERSPRILLVDLGTTGVTMIERMLRVIGNEGQEISRADTVTEAARTLRSDGASCVLLAVRTPDDIDSLEYLQSSAPLVPIVVVSDRDDEALRLGAMRVGAQDCMVKNEVNPTLLGRAISNAIERNRARRGSRTTLFATR